MQAITIDRRLSYRIGRIYSYTSLLQTSLWLPRAVIRSVGDRRRTSVDHHDKRVGHSQIISSSDK